MEQDEPLLLDLQKDQLFAGQDAQGNSLRPSYLDDPYFSSREQAQKYSDWKDTMNQRDANPIFLKRPSGTPNLIITGSWFYDTLIADMGKDRLMIRSDSFLLGKLESKYSKALLGLNRIALKYYVEEILYPRLKPAALQWLKQ